MLQSFDKFKSKEPVDNHISYLPIEYQRHLLSVIANAAYKEYNNYIFLEESPKEGDLYILGYKCNHEIGTIYLTTDDIKKAFNDSKQQ